MPRCDFCREHIEPGTGKMLIRNDGKVVDLCSSKCEKNMFKLRRKPRTTKWTAEYASVKKGTKK
jgi:large subunit ribosomal protein L24e